MIELANEKIKSFDLWKYNSFRNHWKMYELSPYGLFGELYEGVNLAEIKGIKGPPHCHSHNMSLLTRVEFPFM